MMTAYTRIEVNKRGANLYLDEWLVSRPMARSLRARVEASGIQVIEALLPAGTTIEPGRTLNWGIGLSAEQSDDALAVTIHALLQDDGPWTCVFEDPDASRGDPWIDNATCAIAYGEDGSVYELPRSGVIADITAAIRWTGDYPTLCVLTSADVPDLIDAAGIDRIVRSARWFAISAFDGESYLLCTL